MAKAKLKISVADAEKLKLAAEISEVNLGEAKQIGNIIMTEVSFKNASQLFEMGRVLDSIETPGKK